MVVLIHVANVLYVFSYLVKDILWLRALTVVAGLVLLVFYALLPMPLWAAVGWNVVFTAINVGQIRLLLLERRPVRLEANELALYQVGFRSLTRHEFAKLLKKGRWESAAEGDRLVQPGEPLDRLRVVAEGRARVQVEGAQGVELGPGCFIGEMSFLTGKSPTAGVVAIAPMKLFCWSQEDLRALLAGNTELRAAVQRVIGEDLAAKLRPAAS